ncbi:MAG: FAD-dependent oxidoreductase [Acidobacteria bacterium]|nr:FAD-dependent oxidoreductase [Acidobacteriota bacterium]
MTEKVDVAVIGSGVGGLTTAALLARRGLSVAVYEQHYVPGGSASHFNRKGYSFDVGASLLYTLGKTGKANFLYKILTEIDEPIESILDPIQIHYHLPKGWQVRAHYDREKFLAELTALFPKEKDSIRKFYDKLADIFAMMDSLDYISLEDPQAGMKFSFSRPFSAIKLAVNSFKDLGSLVKSTFQDPLLRRFIDLECYSWALVGANATPLINASIVIGDRHVGGVRYPIGGVNKIPYALVRGIEKFGGKVFYRQGVKKIIYENGNITGLELKSGEQVKAKVFVSNATIWNTAELITDEQAAKSLLAPFKKFPASRSFFSVFCGVPKEAIPDDYSTHHIILENWDDMEKDGGTLYLSIPSVLDSSIAPSNCHNVHAFIVHSFLEGKRDRDYMDWKKKTAEELIKRLPLRAKPDFYISASPLTNERYLARKNGSYGPMFTNGKDLLFKPKNLTPIKNLYCAGDSCFPGQGVSAVAASGVSCAMLIAKHFGIKWNQ